MEGYSKIAALMSAYPETLIFRRFGAISAQNILYLQAELVHLEQELQSCTMADQRSADAMIRDMMSKDWYTLAHIDNGSQRQWRLMLQIRAKLKEYGTRSALLDRPYHELGLNKLRGRDFAALLASTKAGAKLKRLGISSGLDETTDDGWRLSARS